MAPFTVFLKNALPFFVPFLTITLYFAAQLDEFHASITFFPLSLLPLLGAARDAICGLPAQTVGVMVGEPVTVGDVVLVGLAVFVGVAVGGSGVHVSVTVGVELGVSDTLGGGVLLAVGVGVGSLS